MRLEYLLVIDQNFFHSNNLFIYFLLIRSNDNFYYIVITKLSDQSLLNNCTVLTQIDSSFPSLIPHFQQTNQNVLSIPSFLTFSVYCILPPRNSDLAREDHQLFNSCNQSSSNLASALSSSYDIVHRHTVYIIIPV